MLSAEKMKRAPSREIDQNILEVLEGLGLATPALVAQKIRRDRRYVANRLSYLTKEGLVEKVMRGVYRTTG